MNLLVNFTVIRICCVILVDNPCKFFVNIFLIKLLVPVLQWRIFLGVFFHKLYRIDFIKCQLLLIKLKPFRYVHGIFIHWIIIRISMSIIVNLSCQFSINMLFVEFLILFLEWCIIFCQLFGEFHRMDFVQCQSLFIHF